MTLEEDACRLLEARNARVDRIPMIVKLWQAILFWLSFAHEPRYSREVTAEEEAFVARWEEERTGLFDPFLGGWTYPMNDEADHRLAVAMLLEELCP